MVRRTKQHVSVCFVCIASSRHHRLPEHIVRDHFCENKINKKLLVILNNVTFFFDDFLILINSSLFLSTAHRTTLGSEIKKVHQRSVIDTHFSMTSSRCEDIETCMFALMSSLQMSEQKSSRGNRSRYLLEVGWSFRTSVRSLSSHRRSGGNVQSTVGFESSVIPSVG
jgi:hypothetical protein